MVEERRRLTGFILTRILLVTLFLISTLILKVKDPDSIGEWAFSRFLLLITVTYLFSLGSLVVSWLSTKITPTIAYFQIIWDLLFVTALLVVTGGIASPFSFLYLLAVINASVLLARREAIYTASLCGILYGALLDFQYFGLLTPLGLTQWQARQYGAGYIFYTIFVNIAAYFLTAFLTGYLAERAHRSEKALEEKAVDLDELTRLHSVIVTSMNSGLMTLDPNRRIKVMNASAEQLTGFTQRDVYDRLLEETLPEFGPVAGTLRSRLEVTLTPPGDVPRILGCTATQLTDREGRDAGIIINFQDVTEIKKMEAELQRADRLAAIGELSARIAHEIRNPLASISGSVQLIAQDRTLRGEDRQLLDIVIRETDRLNKLILDFLAYARPHPPQTIPVPLRRMVDDLRVLMRSDHRFELITFRQEFDDTIAVRVDVDQFIQVLWNIFTNAADAMPGGGEIAIEAERLTSEQNDAVDDTWIEIAVSDTGVGMSSGELKVVFEPFYTTKPGGCGLGMATVYRIIEGHGGYIRVESTPGNGTKFLIYLPDERKT